MRCKMYRSTKYLANALFSKRSSRSSDLVFLKAYFESKDVSKITLIEWNTYNKVTA